MPAKNKDGVIQIGFAADVQDFIKEIKKELASVKDLGLADAFENEIKEVNSMLDGLSKSFSDGMNSKLDTKTFSGFEQKITKEMQTIDKRVTTLEDSMQALVTTMDSADSGKMTSFLQDVGSKMQVLNGMTDETVKAIKELVDIVSKSGGTIKFADNSSVEILEDEKKSLREILTLVEQINNDQNVGSKNLPLNNIAKAQEKMEEAYHALIDVQNDYNKAVQNQADDKEITRLQEKYTKIYSDLEGLRSQFSSIYPEAENTDYAKNIAKTLYEARDVIDEFADRAQERISRVSKQLNTLGEANAITTDKEKTTLYAPLDISTTSKGLITKAKRIISAAQKALDENPLQIQFALQSKYSSRKTNELLKQWQESIGEIDSPELREQFENLYNTIAKDFQKEIKIHVSSDVAKEEVKVQQTIERIKKLVGKKIHIFPEFDIQDADVKKLQSKVDKIAKQLKLNVDLLPKGAEEKSNKQLETLTAISDTLNSKLDNLSKNYLAQIKKSLADILSLAQTLKNSAVQTDAPLDDLVSSVKDLTVAFQRAFGLLDKEDVDGIFERIQNSVKGIRGSLEGSATDNPLVAQLQEILSLYKEYQRLGGTKELSEAGGTKKVQKWLAENYVSETSQIDQFKVEGQNVGSGYAEGIRSSIPEVEKAAEEMTEAALEAIRRTQDSNSPARRAIPLGKDLGGGLIVGLKETQAEFEKTASDVVEGALNSIKESNKEWREYDDKVSVGYDRIIKLQKILDKNVTGKSSLEELLRLNKPAWNVLKSKDFYNNLSGNGAERYGKILEVVEQIDDELLKISGLSKSELLTQLTDIQFASGGNFKQLRKSLGDGWTRFGTYTDDKKDRMSSKDKITYKVYAAFEDIKDLNKDIVSSLLDELTKAGFKGELKTSATSRDTLTTTDQLVIHGQTKKDQEIAYNVVKNLLGQKLSYLSGGIDTASGSFTQTLASGEISKYIQIAEKKTDDFADSMQDVKTNADETAKTIAEIVANAEKLEKVESPLSEKNFKSLQRAYYNKDRADSGTAKNILDYLKMYESSGQTDILKVIRDYVDSSNLKDTLKGALHRTFTSAIEAAEKATVAETKSKPQTQTQTMNKRQYAEYMRKYAPWKDSDEFDYNLNRSIEELQKRGLASRKTTKSGKAGNWEIQVEVPINQLDKLEQKEKEVTEQTKKTSDALSNVGGDAPSKSLQKHIDKYQELKQKQQDLLSSMSSMATSGKIEDPKEYSRLKSEEDATARQIQALTEKVYKNSGKNLQELATTHVQVANAVEKQGKAEEQAAQSSNITNSLQKKIDKYKELRQTLSDLYSQMSSMATADTGKVETPEAYAKLKKDAESIESQMQRLSERVFKNYGVNLKALADGHLEVANAAKVQADAEERVGDTTVANASSDASNEVNKAADAIQEEGKAAQQGTKKKEKLAKAEKKLATESKGAADSTDEAAKAIEKEYKKAEKAREKVIEYEVNTRKAIKEAPKNELNGMLSEMDKPSWQKNFTSEFSAEIQDLRNQIKNLLSQDDVDMSAVDAIRGKFNSLNDTIKDSRLANEKILAEETSITGMQAKIAGFLDQNTAMSRKFKKELKDLLNTLENGGEITKEQLKGIGSAFNRVSAQVKELHQTGQSFGSSFLKQLKSANAQLIATYFSFQDFVRYAREGFQAVVEVDTALTELRKVSDASDERLAQSFKKSTETAKELGATISDVIGVTADWARLNNLGLTHSNMCYNKFSQNGETPEEDNPVGNYMICF